MFGLVTKKRYEREVEHLSDCLEGWKSIWAEAESQKNQFEKANDVLKDEIKMHLTEKADLEKRLYKAVEGLRGDTRYLVKMHLQGYYVYGVYKDGAFSKAVEVPHTSKYPDYEAKRKAGFTKGNMAGVKAVRWTLDNVR